MQKILCSIAILSFCSGCQSLGWSTPLGSQFVTPDAQGAFVEQDDFFGRVLTPSVSQATGNGYVYSVEFNPDVGVRGYAGLMPGASVSDLPPPNTVATLTGHYRVDWKTYETATSTNIQLDRQGGASGVVTLVADIDAGTLIGTSETANDLAVNGTFDGNDLSGTATFRGVTGPLQGLIGADEAIGVFHGSSSNSVHAGGFIAN